MGLVECRRRRTVQDACVITMDYYYSNRHGEVKDGIDIYVFSYGVRDMQLSGAVMSSAVTLSAETQVSSSPAQDKIGTTGRVRLIVNGQARQLEVDVRQSLLDVLRESLNLTGTKKGCNQGA